MSTTTIRLPDELKDRVAKLAQAEGLSSHAFIVQAIAQRTQQAEARGALLKEAQARLAEMKRTGKSLTLEEVRRFARNLVTQQPAKAPKASKRAKAPV